MRKIYVGDGASFVWQWQPKEQIVLEDYPEGVFAHFANCDTVEAPVVQSRMEGDKLVADIPPELMQVDKDITVYICDVDGTKHCHVLSVLSRPKPESYVTEPVEVLRYESLDERVKKLEEEGAGGGSGQNENGLSTTAANLLIEILRNGVYSADQSANITALETALKSGASGDDSATDDITVADGVMTVVFVGSEITVSDGVLAIA